MPDSRPASPLAFAGLQELCAIGSVVEVVIVALNGQPTATSVADIDVSATAPSGAQRECHVTRSKNAFIATFSPNETGEWQVSIRYGGRHIRSSPFPCHVFDAAAVTVRGLDVGLVGQELAFIVDATRAGRGNLAVHVSRDGKPLNCHVDERSAQLYHVHFTPDDATQYKICVTFNEIDVKGSPFLLDIVDASTTAAVSAYGDQLRLAAVGRLAAFFISAAPFGGNIVDSKDIAVIVTGPSKREKHARIIPLDLTTFKAEFKPIDAGEHRIHVLVNDAPIAESPFICNVGDPDLVTAKHMPEAIEARNLNTVHSFEIDATAAGSGNLEIIINGGRIPCRVWETAPRHFQAQFTPTQPVRHIVEMKFNGEHVLHSPWQLPFRGGSGAASPSRRASLRSPLQQPLAGLSPIEHYSELIGQGLRRAAVGQVASFEIKSEYLKIGNVISRLFDTEGRELDVKIIEKSHALRCEYIIKQVGEYRLEVYINGRLIDSGPLFISGYDAGKIRVTPFGDFITGRPVNFTVDAVEAGKGQLEISVNQGQVPNNVQMQDAGRCLVTFIPQHSGTYVIDVTFNGQQVYGCPIKVDVHTKQVGKLVSAPVYSTQTGGAGVGGMPSPAADRGSSMATDRGPSSAYFSASSPQVDTTYSSTSYGAGTPSPYGAALRSPPLVAAAGHGRQSSDVSPTTPPAAVSNEHLRSPRLVQSVGPTESTPQPSVGYTVAQYGAGENRRSSGERRFAGTSRPENAQFEMTRSTELTLRNTPPTSARHSVQPPTQTPENVGTILKSSKTYKRFELIGDGDLSPRSPDQPPTSRGDDHSIADALRQRNVYDEIPTGGGLTISQKVHELAYTPLKLDEHSSGQQTIPDPCTLGDVDYTHVVEPHVSNIDALTPSTQRKLLENSVINAADLKESDGGEPMSPELIMRQQSGRADEPPRSEPSSKHSSKPTTPRLGLKFGKSSGSGKEMGSPVGRVGFDFGKSKITSKNEVVRRGKDVEVKVESLKLGKDDQLKVVVMAPSRKGQQPVQQPAGEALSPPEVPHKLKKSRNTYEISFRPTEVGTHKVLLFVNNQFPHPQTPFPIRVYDAAEIIVGEIVGESAINDTVEFTVDAGRAGFGNLEMAIKDSDQCIIPSHVSQLEAGTAKFLVTFNPTSLGVHTVNITFNKEVIKDSPFEVNVIEYVGGKYGGESSTLERKRRDKVKDKKDKKKDRSSSTKSGSSGTSTKRDRSTGGGDSATIGRSLVVSKIPSLSRVDRPAELIVTLPAASSRLEARIYDCEKEVIPSKILEDQENANARCIQFVPKRFGDHEIELRLDGEDVNGSPFTCRVYDPTRIVVSPIPDAIVDVPVHFTVDAAAAGVGNLEVAVNDGKIPSMAHALGQHKYDISFTPRELADHYVSVRFNNERVPGSPFLCRVVEAGAAGGGANFGVSGPGLERVPIQRPVEFWITVPDGETNKSIEPPEVSIIDPHGEPIEAHISRDLQDHTRFLIIYTPSSVGNHQVDVRWDGEPLAGAPFTSKAFDANAARLILAEGGAEVGLPCTFTIDAAKAGAGNMEIIVSVGKRNVPNFVTAEGQAKFKVSFTPQEANDHQISVKFNGIPIPGSPMRCPVSGPSGRSRGVSLAPPTTRPDNSAAAVERRLADELAVAAVGRVKRFVVDAPPSLTRNTECDVVVLGPTKDRRVPVTVRHIDASRFDIEFTPTETGDHFIKIRLNGRPLCVRPIVCRVSQTAADAGMTTVADQETVSTTSSAPCDVRFAQFPRHALIDRTSEFELDVVRGAEKGLQVDVLNPKSYQGQVSLRRLDTTASGSWQRHVASWEPRCEGRPELRVHLDGERLAARDLFADRSANDLHVDVPDLSAVRIIGLPSEHESAKANEPLIFQLDWSKSGGSELRVETRHESTRRAIFCETITKKRGSTECRFTPPLAGRYLIDVYVDELKLPECPYECVVCDRTGSRLATPTDALAGTSSAFRAVGEALRIAQRGKVATFSIVAGDGTPKSRPHSDLDVVVSDARRGPLPVRCYKQQDGSYAVEFTPEQIGTHKIEITFADVPLASSPFHCEVVDPARVTLRGVDEPLAVRAVANIVVNRVNAGAGDLTLELRDSHGTQLKLNRVRGASGEDTFTFLPTKLGPHTLNASLAGYPLPGTPRTLIVEEPSWPCVYGAALDYACVVGQQASMIFDAKHVTGGLKIQVVPETEDGRPDGAKLRHTTDKRLDGTTEIAFRPTRVGYYRVTVDFNNQPVSGSPIRVAVVDPERVALRGEALGDGMLHMRAGVTSVIDVDASGAGPGTLRVEVRGAQQSARVNTPDSFTDDVATRVHDFGFGQWRVEVTPRAGASPQRRCKMYFYWAELVVPSAYPLAAIIDGETPEQQTPKPARSFKTTTEHTVQNGHDTFAPIDIARQIFIDGDGAAVAALKSPTEFFVDASALRTSIDGDRLDALLAGERADVPVRITVADRPNVFLASYMPLVAGRYELSVRYGGEHVQGSPATVDVRGHMTAAELIKVDTKTLQIGIIGEDVKTVIDARQAKAGHLSAQCVGPSQIEYCELFDNRDRTYLLRVTPKELGRHQLTIKYAGDHVPGSPFTFNVSNPPDAGQVRVYGPGIEHGILHSFKSNFVVETKGAGAGQLTVRVRGPKGAFNVEMQRDRQQDRTIHCKYEPREPGDYQVEIKWHGQHVPGSPFLVLIVDTEEELHRFLAGGAPSPPPTTPFAPPGWLPPSPGMIGRGPPLPHMLPAPPLHLLGGPPPQHMPQHYYPHHHPAALPHPIYGQRPSPRAHRY